MKIENLEKISLVSLALALLMVGTTDSRASSLSVTNTWSGGQKLNATDLNKNFTDTEAAVNDNNTRISANTANIATLQSKQAAMGTTASCGLSCPGTTTGSTATVNIRSVSVTTGSTGRVMVYFNSSVECNAPAATNYVYLYTQIVTSATASPIGYNDGGSTIRGEFGGTGYFDYPVSVFRSFPVTSSGVHTYYVNGRNFSATAIGCKYYAANMDAIYIP